jgi:hypothetical protein
MFTQHRKGMFMRSKMKLHKFSFKNEAIWMLIVNSLPLVAGILITLLLFAFRWFDL